MTNNAKQRWVPLGHIKGFKDKSHAELVVTLLGSYYKVSTFNDGEICILGHNRTVLVVPIQEIMEPIKAFDTEREKKGIYGKWMLDEAFRILRKLYDQTDEFITGIGNAPIRVKGKRYEVYFGPRKEEEKK